MFGMIVLFVFLWKVIHFEQQRYNIRVLRNTSPTFNDPKWGDMWYFVSKSAEEFTHVSSILLKIAHNIVQDLYRLLLHRI